jgi:hypothetical protein
VPAAAGIISSASISLEPLTAPGSWTARAELFFEALWVTGRFAGLWLAFVRFIFDLDGFAPLALPDFGEEGLDARRAIFLK